MRQLPNSCLFHKKNYCTRVEEKIIKTKEAAFLLGIINVVDKYSYI